MKNKSLLILMVLLSETLLSFATATSPLGPWTKYESNPIFQNQYGLAGTKDQIHPRRVYIGDVFFDKSYIPIMKIGGKIISTRKKE